MRALAEAPQMLMKFADLNYEYLMSWDYFDDDWEMVKPTIPFQQLPILVVDGEHQKTDLITGLNSGGYTEIINGEIEEGDEVISKVIIETSNKKALRLF